MNSTWTGWLSAAWLHCAGAVIHLFQPTWPFDRLGVPMCTSNKVFLSIRNNKIQGNSKPVWITIINFKAALFSNHELFFLQQTILTCRTIHWPLACLGSPAISLENIIKRSFLQMFGLGTGSNSVDCSLILKVLETGKIVFSYLSLWFYRLIISNYQ